MAKPHRDIRLEYSHSDEQNEFLSGKPMPSLPEKKKSSRGRKSLKDAAEEAEEIVIPDDEILFQKQYYSLGAVAAMLNANNSLIRYWANEFEVIEPRKNRKGDRLFTPADVKTLYLIYDLLRRRKFTLEGAKEYLKRDREVEERFALIQSLQRLKSFLLELKAHL